MTLARGLLALVILPVLFAPGAGAQQQNMPVATPSQQVPCQPESFKGIYVLAYFKETPEGSETRRHAHFSHEYVNFYPQTLLYKILTINSEIATPAKVKEALGPVTSYKKYTLTRDGVLELYTNDKIGYSYYRCAVSIKDDGAYRKGDLFLTGASKTGEGVIYKLYRHWY